MTALRRIGVAAALLVLVVGGLVLSLRLGAWNTDRDEVTAKWAQGPSKFISIDDVPIHYRDEGEGPVVVLLHGSIVSLHEWDAVAERLKGRFRVIRFDWAPYGLSGPDPKGVYTTARAAELMDGLLKALEVEKFALVSTSNGANVALEYNRQFPGNATAMAFSVLPLERPSQDREIDWRLQLMLPFHKHLVPDWRSHLFYRLVLEDTTPDSFKPTAAMVDQIYDLNNLPGALDRQKSYIASNTKLFQTTDVAAIAETVTVPVLLQWCAYDTVISQTARQSVDRFTNTKVDLIEYDDLGHFPMWEDPDRFTADMIAFFDRELPVVATE
ncbi:alpha/beta hydrolase [Sphingorhabdus sp. YGSMI21]|uniref:alpha/beta fold hydrolase n=1 Tax=Sphingorhabdus sp. YGSMI21 TaxID=2077182 RepID=UPI000C1F3DFB|nr:alpha/beta hydrolase [Sphingorhabdus sp. YGSMI21]ATW03392.1 alpha/beta hydrolase [Sphingorhabdus sp. YGSMI21]